jgi:hypothetical protein
MNRIGSVTLVLAAAALSACSDSSGPASSGPQASFQLATSAGGPASGMAAIGGPEVLVAGSDTITVTSVQMVLREIELNRLGGAACDTTLADDSCEEFELDSQLFDLPLGGGAQRAITVPIDPGTYDRVEFKVHKPESSDDAGFLALHPEFDGVSIKMTGTYNGTAFTFISDLDAEQEHDLVPPVLVDANSSLGITMFVDLQAWFLNQAGDGFIDPASANKGGQYEGEVKSNIEASIDAFEDHDRDGVED